MTAENEQVTLQPGDYIATSDLSEADYHNVARAFMAAGAGENEYDQHKNGDKECWDFFGWEEEDGLALWDNPSTFADENRQLTLSQILNATNAGSHTKESTADTHMHLADRLEAAIRAQSEANAEVERLKAEWRVAYPNISGCVDIDVEDIKPEDWQAGDIVECITDERMFCTKGKEYIVEKAASEGGSSFTLRADNDGDKDVVPISSFRFIRRP